MSATERTGTASGQTRRTPPQPEMMPEHGGSRACVPSACRINGAASTPRGSSPNARRRTQPTEGPPPRPETWAPRKSRPRETPPSAALPPEWTAPSSSPAAGGWTGPFPHGNSPPSVKRNPASPCGRDAGPAKYAPPKAADVHMPGITTAVRSYGTPSPGRRSQVPSEAE